MLLQMKTEKVNRTRNKKMRFKISKIIFIPPFFSFEKIFHETLLCKKRDMKKFVLPKDESCGIESSGAKNENENRELRAIAE